MAEKEFRGCFLMSAKKRVLVIGLDGFTWKLGREFISEGVMPNLANLVKNGGHGDLRSVIPCETSPAWSSFQTGCLPGKTSIFAFHRYDRNRKEVSLNSFENNAMPSLWELASRGGKKIVSLNMPVSSPPPEVNGIIIPGLLCPKLSAKTVYPPQAYDKYIKHAKNYLIVNNVQQKTTKEFTEQSVATERARCNVAMELMKDVDWDIFSVQIQSNDIMQHRLWWALDSQARGFDPEQRKFALGFYRECDNIIGKIIRVAGPNTLTLIASDHGFCAQEKSFAVNVWLKQQGYLHLLPKEPESKWKIVKKKVPPLKCLAWIYGHIAKKLVPGKIMLCCETDLTHLRQVVDFEKTQAFCLGAMAGLIYLSGSKQQKSELAKKLTADLLEEFGPESKTQSITRISSGQQMYGCTEAKAILPDLVLELKEGVVAKTSPYGMNVVSSQDVCGKQQGTHHLNGAFVGNGPGVNHGTKFDAEIVDIAPTVLAYLGLPVPLHMDGKVLQELFDKPLDVRYEQMEFTREVKNKYMNSEQAKVEQQLADLGYI